METPLRVAGMMDVEKVVKETNEQYLRAYVLQDPVHAKFVHEMLEALNDYGSSCSAEHNCEDWTIRVALEYTTAFAMQWKVLPSVEATIATLSGRARRCVQCAKAILGWFLKSGESRLLDFFVQGPTTVGRRGLSILLVAALKTLKENDHDRNPTHFEEFTKRLLSGLKDSWMTMVVFRPCWPDYFGLVIQISQLHFVALLPTLQLGFLKMSLDLILVHGSAKNIADTASYQAYAEYIAQRDKRRDLNYNCIVEFLLYLLQKIDLSFDASSNRIFDAERGFIGVTPLELQKLRGNGRPRWIQYIIETTSVPELGMDLAQIVAGEPTLCDLAGQILINGLSHKNSATASSYIEPSLRFLQYCCDERVALSSAHRLVQAVEGIDLNYGLEFLSFITRVGQLGNAELGLAEGYLQCTLRDTVQDWLPGLLYSQSEHGRLVRDEAYGLFDEFAGMTDAPNTLPSTSELEGFSEESSRISRARELTYRIVKAGQDYFIHHRRSNPIERDHFKYALKAFNRCRSYGYPDPSSLSTKVKAELKQEDEVMSYLTNMRETVVNLIDANDFEGSSDADEMSDDLYETEGVARGSPA